VHHNNTKSPSRVIIAPTMVSPVKGKSTPAFGRTILVGLGPSARLLDDPGVLVAWTELVVDVGTDVGTVVLVGCGVAVAVGAVVLVG
jgi:hypothetical protein